MSRQDERLEALEQIVRDRGAPTAITVELRGGGHVLFLY